MSKDVLEEMLAEQELGIYDILPDLGSYLADLEGSLQYMEVALGDGQDWDAYQSDPVPFVVDVLLDFGTWPDSIQAGAERIEEAERLANQWAHPVRA